MRMTNDNSIDPGQLLARGQKMKPRNEGRSQETRPGSNIVMEVFALLKIKALHLFHSAGGPSEPFGPHELERWGPLAENWVCQNIQPIYFNQNCGMTQPGDSQAWARVREVWVLDKIRFHHWELAVQSLRRRRSSQEGGKSAREKGERKEVEQKKNQNK